MTCNFLQYSVCTVDQDTINFSIIACSALDHILFVVFFQYTPAIDIWSIGCIFAELLTGKPLFPGKNVVHQLDLMTDLLGTPSAEAIARVCSMLILSSWCGYNYFKFISTLFHLGLYAFSC